MRSVLIGVLVATAAPLWAQQQQATEVEIEAMVTAIEAAGCVVTPENDGAVTAASGLEAEQIMAAILALYQEERVIQQSDGSLKLDSPNCP